MPQFNKVRIARSNSFIDALVAPRYPSSSDENDIQTSGTDSDGPSFAENLDNFDFNEDILKFNLFNVDESKLNFSSGVMMIELVERAIKRLRNAETMVTKRAEI